MQALARDRFDLVLMDVQMPEMDGVEATTAIRHHELQTGQHVPIIAMTAYALKGSREQYLGAGMDAYISKPVRPRELYEAIAALVGQRVEQSGSSPPAMSNSFRLDWSTALEATAGDGELLADVVRAFLTQREELMTEFEAALSSGDAERLKRPIHTLRGALSHFGIAEALTSAERMREKLRAGDSAAAREAWIAFRAAMNEIANQMNSFVRGGVPEHGPSPGNRASE
jgi:response regulator RpfG family c-di-GMP phosphodiesterase